MAAEQAAPLTAPPDGGWGWVVCFGQFVMSIGLIGQMLYCPILGTGRGLCTGGFPGSGSRKEEFEIHGKFMEGFQKLSETFRKLLDSFWKLP